MTRKSAVACLRDEIRSLRAHPAVALTGRSHLLDTLGAYVEDVERRLVALEEFAIDTAARHARDR